MSLLPFPTKTDSLPKVIAINFSIVCGILMGGNSAGAIMAERSCPANARDAYVDTESGRLARDFCLDNKELSIVSPTRTATNLKMYKYILARKLGLAE